MSPQIDVLVLKPFYPSKLREKKVWLANGVAAAFECKTTLRTEHISASAHRCKAFKALFARQTGSPARELRSSLLYGVLAHSHAWKEPGSKPGDNVDKALTKANLDAIHPSDLIDILCIADVGCWSGMVVPRYEASWNPSYSGHLEGIFGGAWGPVSSMMRSSIDATDQHEAFQPIGGMLAYLTQRMAWENSAIRDLADYYRLTRMWGQGQGGMRFWPQTVLSEEVR